MCGVPTGLQNGPVLGWRYGLGPAMNADDDDFDAAADELYGLEPEEFTASRNARAKRAKQGGQRELAASIQALAKPNAVAVLANRLVRRNRAELSPLLELGAALRAATAALSGPELRTLGQQRRRLIAALAERARTQAEEQGQPVGADAVRGLEETLHAALADEEAASQLMAGRLSRGLRRSGLGGSDQSALSALTLVKAGPPARTRAAEDELKRARAEQADAERQADAGAADLDRAAAVIGRLREELDRATADRQRLDQEQHRMRSEVNRARRSVRAAQSRLDRLG